MRRQKEEGRRQKRIHNWLFFCLVPCAFCLLGSAPAFAQDAKSAAEAAFKNDVHAAAGLTCQSCHTGPATAATPYSPIPRGAVAESCAKCHSDAAYMHKFNPQVRVDQLAQYLTSKHGRDQAKGETRTATCSDCHSSHGVVRVKDTRSPVAPMNVATTCAKCHTDVARMKAFNHEANQFSDWSSSVHAEALLKRGDTSAPTCSTCHGSHGATPPGTAEVSNVCAQCHVREADFFNKSPKKAIFEAMGQAQCLVCHGNHAIHPPTPKLVGLDKDAVCSQCHDEASNGAPTIRKFREGLEGLSAAMVSATEVVDRAEQSGMLVDDARKALHDAREQNVLARVSVHAFAPEPFTGVHAKGIEAATKAQQAGVGALEELQSRRRGLGVATLLIIGFLITLAFKIRRLPTPP
jgi:predicted CXXCH cytochrome family protein